MQEKKTKMKEAIKAFSKDQQSDIFKLMEEAQLQYDSAWQFSYEFRIPFLRMPYHLHVCLCILKTVSYDLVLISETPEEECLHDLFSLAAFDLSKLPDVEQTGADIMAKHQRLMLEHWGHKDSAILPDDVVQHILLGVGYFLWIL